MIEMKRLVGLVCFIGAGLWLHGEDKRPAKPNVLLMLVDDLGWQDVVCYDLDEPCPYETPNLDKLAKRGVLFRNGYSPASDRSAALCFFTSNMCPPKNLRQR